MTGLADAIVALEAACFEGGAWTAEQVAGSLGSPGAVAVTVGPDAYAFGKRVLDEVELYRIGVRPLARRRGLGTRVLSSFEESARSQGATVLHLEVRADNAPAIALYARHGLQECGRRPRYYSDGCDAVWMSVSLTCSRD